MHSIEAVRSLVVLALVFQSISTSLRAEAQSKPAAAMENIARGRPYTLAPAPNYPHCTDPADATQLTDGELTDGYFWTQPGTVGWSGIKYACVIIDLGKVQPIAGVSLRTAAGKAGVTWPTAIRIHVSNDGKAFRDVGDLMALDPQARHLPGDYAVVRFATSVLKAKGRYVRLVVIPSGPFTFADEIEVFRGDDSLLTSEPEGQPVTSLDDVYLQYKIDAGIRRRFDADLAGVEQSIRNSKLESAIRSRLLTRAEELRPKLMDAKSTAAPADFRTILPFNDTHAELFRIQAALWKTAGCPALSAWPTCQWDPMDLFAAPPDQAHAGNAPLQVHTMRGEYRSAAFNLANATDAPMEVRFRLADISGAPTPTFVAAYRVPWTDTISGKPVAAALVEVAPADGAWTVKVLPGLTQQIWLNFHVTDLPAGQHNGNVVIAAPGMSDIALPLSLQVYPLQFPRSTSLWVGGWSYTDGQGRYGITPANHAQLVQHLRSHFVNAPWATSEIMSSFTFKGDVIELDTRRLDDWLAQWPDAKAYFAFASTGRTFAGAQMGTREFEVKVKAWITACVRHLASKGVSADRLGLLLVDEPQSHEQDEVIIAWAKAIHAAEPKVLIWEDPIYRDPKQGMPEMFELSNILCPNRPMWLAAGPAFETFYRSQQKAGRTLQLYSCSGPARLLDPYSYFRLQAWHCRQIGATASFFWAFGDNSNASSWNEYAATAGPFTPLFLDAKSVTAAKQMEAIRESVEDYEYFVMLERGIEKASAANTASPAVAKARDLLQHAADEVLAAEGAKNLTWHAPKDRTRADAIRVELLEALAALSPRPN